MSARRRLLAVPIVVAVAMNLALLALYYVGGPKPLVGDEVVYFARATEFAAGEVPRHEPLWPALYGDAMGRLFESFGVERLPVQATQIVMWLLTALLWAEIARRLLDSRPAAYATLLLLLLSPELMAYSHFLWPETPHLFFFALALWLLIRAGEHWLGLAGAGVALGIALLLKLLLLPFLPVIAGFLLWRGSGGWRRRLAKVAVVFTAVALTVFPTLQHNHVVHGRWMIADSSAFNLWVGLTDVELADFRHDAAGRALGEFQASGPTFEARSAAFRARIRELVDRKGWGAIVADQLGKQYFRLLHHQTFFTTQLPGGPRSAYRFEAPALVSGIRAYAYTFHALLLWAGVLGLFALRVRPVGWLHVLVAFVGYNLALFLFAHVKTRYAVQFMPVLMLSAGITALQVIDLVRGRGLSHTKAFVFSPARIAVGLVCAVAVELVAFREAIVLPS
jgi:4-amino-4-deoxy-L-arabinose transferase-like glycosyltransferase